MSTVGRKLAKLMKEVIFELDFPIKSIQVDGGSEFMAEFEEYCEEQGIKLYVLHLRSPKINGCTVRRNELIVTNFGMSMNYLISLKMLKNYIENIKGNTIVKECIKVLII